MEVYRAIAAKWESWNWKGVQAAVAFSAQVKVLEPEIVASASHQELEYARRHRSATRQLECLAARYIARVLMQSTSPIVTHSSGFPMMNAPWIGSLTHKAGSVGAAVSLSESLSGIGIDLEAANPLRKELESRIATESELEIAKDFYPRSSALIFAAKESLYKALYPQVLRPFYFQDAHVVSPPDSRGAFSIELATDLSADHRRGNQFPCHVKMLTGVDDRSYFAVMVVDERPRPQSTITSPH